MANSTAAAPNGTVGDARIRDVPLRSLLERRIRPSKTTDSAPEQDPLNITLGIELEFLLAVSTYPDNASSENYDEPLAQDVVRYALSQPMVGTCATCGREHVFQLPVHLTMQSDYEHWTVDDDHSLDIPGDERAAFQDGNEGFFPFYQLEVTSRILRPGRNYETTPADRATGHVHEIDYVQEIDAVLNRLHDFFTGTKASKFNKVDSVHIIVNRTCGLHVHIGNEMRGFPLPTVKKILSTYVANERAIDGLHSASRISGNRLALETLRKSYGSINRDELHLLPSAYNESCSMRLIEIAHTLRRHRHGYNAYKNTLPMPHDCAAWIYPETHLNDPKVSKAVDSFSVADWLEVIDRAPSLKAIHQLQGGYGRATLNLQNLGPYDSQELSTSKTVDENDDDAGDLLPRMMTIEFRQHAGTLDGTEIHAWIDVVVSMVSHAHYTTDADYRDISRNEWLKPDYGSLDLIRALGCSLDTKRFYRHRLGMTRWSPEPDVGVFAADLSEFDLFPVDKMIAPLLEYVEWKRRDDLLPAIVGNRIKEKFRMGGYGTFSREYLASLGGEHDLYDPQLRLMEKLETGWENHE